MSVSHAPAAELEVLIVGTAQVAAAVRALVMSSGMVAAADICTGPGEAHAHLAVHACDAVVLAVSDAGELEVAGSLRARAAQVSIVVTMAEDAGLREQALKLGAQDCLALPGLEPRVLGYALLRAIERAVLERERGVHSAELRALFDLGAHPMWVCDPVSRKLVAANQVAIDTYGYSEEEFRAMSIAGLRASAQAAGSDDRDTELPTPGTTCIEHHCRKDASQIEVELFAQAVPLWGRDMRLVQARDVTVERRAMRALEASERRFRDFFEHSTGFICIHDLDGTLLSVNPAAAAALGRTVAELLGTPLRELSQPHLRFLVDQYLQRVAANGEDAGFVRVLHRNGAELIWQYRNRLYTDADGCSYVMGYAQDITAMRAAEHAFRLSEQRLRTIADTLPLKIAYLDAQEQIVFANEAFRNAYAPGGVDIAGQPVADIIGQPVYAQRQPYLARALGGERTTSEHEEGEGETYHCVEVTFIPEFSESRAHVIGVHAMVQDVTAKKREQQRLTLLARIDSLSGLLNRAGFHERLENAIARSRDQDTLLAVFYLDIDHFKQVNDTHGHAVGDMLIRAFAARLAEKVRASDVVARLGGDEFTVAMESIPDLEHVRTIASKLVKAMERPFELRASLNVTVGTSIGVALCRAASIANSSDLLARADAMLYAAKQAGRGTWRIDVIEAGEGVSGQRGQAVP